MDWLWKIQGGCHKVIVDGCGNAWRRDGRSGSVAGLPFARPKACPDTRVARQALRRRSSILLVWSNLWGGGSSLGFDFR